MSEETRGVVREKVTGRPDIFVKEWFADYLWDLFCPGCQTPVLARIIAEALEELGIGDEAYGWLCRLQWYFDRWVRPR